MYIQFDVISAPKCRHLKCVNAKKEQYLIHSHTENEKSSSWLGITCIYGYIFTSKAYGYLSITQVIILLRKRLNIVYSNKIFPMTNLLFCSIYISDVAFLFDFSLTELLFWFHNIVSMLWYTQNEIQFIWCFLFFQSCCHRMVHHISSVYPDLILLSRIFNRVKGNVLLLVNKIQFPLIFGSKKWELSVFGSEDRLLFEIYVRNVPK